jgi:hypothetical protein
VDAVDATAVAELYMRTSDEAELYMQLHPCECGDPDFRADLELLQVDGTRVIRYEGECVTCGLHREFCFRHPDSGLSEEWGSRYGPPGWPSRLLDAGEWLLVADLLADAAHTLLAADDPSNNEVRTGCDMLAAAVEATVECLKFVAPDVDAVPESSVWSEPGQLLRSSDPDRFARTRLTADIERGRELVQVADQQFIMGSG